MAEGKGEARGWLAEGRGETQGWLAEGRGETQGWLRVEGRPGDDWGRSGDG